MIIWGLLFFIYWLGILMMSSTVLYIAIFPEKIDIYSNYLEYTNFNIIKIIIISIALFYIIMSISKVFFVFSRDDKNVKISNKYGDINISFSAIDNLIKALIINIDFIKSATVRTYIKKNNINVKIDLNVDAVRSLSEQLKDLQDLIKKEIKHKTSIEIQNLDIKVKKLNHDSKYVYEEKYVEEENNEKNIENDFSEVK
ncbi:MAG: alkaline shock response membrane anchor protein AmaP [Fusobacteria bacterium]|nr:alkaline shock response membrane anchor protein AmaP [Fusobacteriota bacterium]